MIIQILLQLVWKEKETTASIRANSILELNRVIDKSWSPVISCFGCELADRGAFPSFALANQFQLGFPNWFSTLANNQLLKLPQNDSVPLKKCKVKAKQTERLFENISGFLLVRTETPACVLWKRHERHTEVWTVPKVCDLAGLLTTSIMSS